MSPLTNTLRATGALLACVIATPVAAQVTGTVYLDRNANGVRDAGESGMAGVVVSNQSAVARTDASGHYALAPGGFGVTFVSIPRHHRASSAWWKSTAPGGTADFGLAPYREPVPFTFVQASDTHIAPASVPRSRRMIALVDSLAPSLLIVTGDLVRDALRVGESEATGYYQLFAQEMKALRRPYFTVPGNHENFGIERTKSKVDASHPLYGRKMYRQFLGPDYYSFNAGGVHFVALNSVDIDDQWYYGHVDSLQLAWLKRDLAMVPDSVPVVTFNHIPMASMAEGLNGFESGGVAPSIINIDGKPQYRHTVSNTDAVAASMGAHRWDIALAGHVHFRETLAVDVGGRRMRFHQTAATVGDGGAGPFKSPSSVTLYTIRNGRVDDGRVVPLGAVAQPRTPAARVDSLADAIFAARLDLEPEFATSAGLTIGAHGRISDNSRVGLRRAESHWDALYAVARSIDPNALVGTPQWVTYGTLRESLESDRALRVCRLELWGVAAYVNGWQAIYTDLARLQPVGTDSARAHALQRLHALPKFLDNEIANLRVGLRLGYSSPKVIVRNVIGQLDGILATPVPQSPFHSSADRDTTSAFRVAMDRAIEQELNPAIKRYRDFLQKEYLPAARTALGVSANPNGAACYRATVRSFATVDTPADSVYAIGLAQMQRIQDEMRVIAARSFGRESIPTLLQRLRTDPKYTFRTSQEIIDTSQAVVDRARKAMGAWFGRLPKANVVIEPYPEFRQKAGAPGQLQAAAQDGSRPAIFLINPSKPTDKSRADAENTAMHEAIPGHHLQTAIAQERTDLHPLLRYSFSSGFGEGWALYAERLGDEMGLYSSDVGRMGMLGSEAFRAARMVIDAGVHTKGWTREQALDYLLSHTVLPRNIAEGEIDRYISWPGQAPSYMIGRLEIMRLREQARRTMGAKFDIRTFHDLVLEDGTVPLALLRAKVERWIAEQKK